MPESIRDESTGVTWNFTDDGSGYVVISVGGVDVSSTNGLPVSIVTDSVVTKVDEGDSVTYVGKAANGSATSESVWQIKSVSVDGTVTTIGYADGDDSYNNVWDDRASYTYS